MKRFFAVLMVGCMLGGMLVGCGEEKEPLPPLSVDEIQEMYVAPQSFTGREVEIVGKVFVEPETYKDGLLLQVSRKPDTYEQNTIVSYSGADLEVKNGDYVKVSGTVTGAFKGENVLGGVVTAPQINATSISVLSYTDAVSPTLLELKPAEPTQDQYGYSVTVEKIELAEKETRVYVSVTNNGSDKFSLYSFNAKLLQDGKQIGSEMNYDAGYPEIESDLVVGATTNGIIVFPAIESGPFQIHFEAYTNNFDEKVEPYVFDIADAGKET